MSKEIEKATLDFSVSPKSSKSKLTLDNNGNIKIYLNSPPVDGKANSECIRILSKFFKIAKSQIEIIKGEKGRKKRVTIMGISEKKIKEILMGSDKKI